MTVDYRLDPTRPVPAEVRRALAEQLDRAVEELRAEGGPDAAAIHRTRKRIKKARSLLRLARAELGPAVVRLANAELRTVAGDLAGQRDADSLVEAAGRLGPAAAPEEVAALGRLAELLAAAADQVRAEGGVDRSAVLGATSRLTQTAAWLRRLPPRAEGWAALEPGLRRQYARGRRAFGGLPDVPTAEELHEWRKRAKDLWYHQRLLAELWPDAQRPIEAAAEALADHLGDDHDLALLLVRMDGFVADGRLHADDAALVTSLVQRERARLQHDARRLGALLYADAPAAWAARHGAWWEAAADTAPPSGTA